MAEVREEDIVEVFGRVAPDYSDIPPETWRQVVSSLYGMEKREFDAFVDELEAQSKEGGTPDIRRSLVEIYDNAKKQVRETPSTLRLCSMVQRVSKSRKLASSWGTCTNQGTIFS